jgi:serine/threonine protein kinase
MHSKGYVHRDLKPENVLLEKKGDPNNLKLIDFGTAIRFKAVKG